MLGRASREGRIRRRDWELGTGNRELGTGIWEPGPRHSENNEQANAKGSEGNPIHAAQIAGLLLAQNVTFGNC